jgi:hypothetical protein
MNTLERPEVAEFLAPTGQVIGFQSEADNLAAGTLDSGGGATVRITVRAKQVGMIINTAQVTSQQPDPDLADNTDTETTTVLQR